MYIAWYSKNPSCFSPPVCARVCFHRLSPSAGWITRAWLAEECSDADRGNTLSLTMLGTPNNNPPKENPVGGDWTALDQTRGLLRNINERFPGAYVDSVQYTSVCGTALQGS